MRFPVIPQEIRLQVSQVPPSFNGRLYFVLGPGLGDALNDLRILHQTLILYPNVRSVVYADPRWKDVYDCIPELKNAEVRYYSPAPSAEAQQPEKAPPYHHTFRGVVQEIVEECSPGSGWVAVGGFKLGDQLARKESSLTMRARAIGFSFKEEECRPYFSLPQAALSLAQVFLQAQGLTPGCYFVIAPYTWPEKMWDHQSWEVLVSCLYESTGLPTLVIGTPGYPPVQGPAVREALGLPLPEVAALISQARCYVGLDTGPTHLAASFDLPIVALNPQGKFPPFLVEPHSPFKWIHLVPGIYGQNPIPVTSAFQVVCRAMDRSVPPTCLVCWSQPYVLGANRSRLLYICRCGLMFMERTQVEEVRKDPGASLMDPSHEVVLPLPTASEKIDHWGQSLNSLKHQGKSILISFDHWDPIKIDPFTLLEDSTGQTVWWNWDSAYYFLSQLGWQVIESDLKPTSKTNKTKAASFSVCLRVVPSKSQHPDCILRVPWGDRVVSIPRMVYENWLSWGIFRNQGELEGLGWSLVHQGEKASGRFVLKMAFQVEPRWRSLRRFLLARWG